MSILVGATSACAGAAGSQAAAADLGETIEQSLRFTGDGRLVASTSATTGNFTISFWWKRAIGVTNTHTFLMFTPNQAYQFTQGTEDRFAARVASFDYLSDGKLRDHSAWYHVVLVNNGGTTTMYLNGVQQSDTATTPSGGGNMCIGSNSTSLQDDRLVGYLAEYNLLDGQTLSPTDFGRYNDDDIWVPIELNFTATQYGAKGFRLKFDSSADGGIGDDSAPIGTGHTAANDFTATGFDTAAISSSNTDNDIDFNDTPTSNYATLNGVLSYNQTLSDANLTGGAGSSMVSLATIVPQGKIYWEGIGSNYYYGISHVDASRNSYLGQQADQVGWFRDGTFWVGAANVGTFGPAFTTSDVAMLAYDPDTGKLWVGKNGTWHNSGNPTAGTGEVYTVNADFRERMVPANNVSSGTASINFGQMNFVHTQPTGFEALQTNNLPEPTIKNGKDHFDVLTWTGNGTADRAITGLEFQPALVWIKNRAATNLDYIVADGIMGANRRLRSNTSDAFGSTTDFRTFTSDGFTLGDQSITNGGSSPNTYVAWCWNAASSNSSNTSGDITTTIRTNTDAGFCCMGFTGSTSAQKLGHGLTAEPEFVISKCVGVGSTSWQVYHKTLGVGSFLPFTTSAMSNISSFWGSASDWNATTCGCSNNDSDNNKTDELMRWYIWHGVEGFSKFGDYTGNGNAEGSFVYLGFMPRLVVIRAAQTGTNGQEPWFVYDTAREPNNVKNQPLEWNSQNAEGATSRDIDFLSNGFKLRSAANQVNGNGTNYIYAAWASHPYGGENAPPATAH